jgi:hypothetical protein
MNNLFNNIKPKTKNFIKNGIIYSFVSGFSLGLLPNTINIRLNQSTFYNVPSPLISGCVCMTGFIFSPLLITNYFFERSFFDKLIDKYKITIHRYYQHANTDDKYELPSLLFISIDSKN